jgi:formylmethanofuran dehydrogenase subunit B
VTCDDLVLSVDGARVVHRERACHLANDYFDQLAAATGLGPTLQGQECSLDQACAALANWVAEAEMPLMAGLGELSCEAIKLAIELADRHGMVIDATATPADRWGALSLQTVGSVTATWGEVAQRAQVVVYWAIDPDTTHPRLAERYTELPARLSPHSTRPPRYVVVVDDRDNATAPRADCHMHIAAGAHYASLAVLRALAAGLPLDAARVLQSTGVELAKWTTLSEQLAASDYGAVVYGKRLLDDGPHALSALTRLVTSLTANARWVAIAGGAAGNTTGAINLLTSQTGFPLAVDLTQGVPRYCPGEYDYCTQQQQRECDLVLHFSGVPVGLVARRQVGGQTQHLHIPLAQVGWDTAGTTYRSDGVALPRRPLVRTERLTAEAVLAAIAAKLASH